MHDVLQEEAFNKALREPLLKYSVYGENFSDQVGTFEHVRERLEQAPEKVAEIPLYNLMNATQHTATGATAYLANCYSAGHGIGELQAFYERAMEYWETYAHYNQAYNDSNEREASWPHIALASPDYHHALAMVCFGLLLGKQDSLHRLVPLIDYRNEKRDALVERLLSCCVDGRAPDTSVCRRNLPYANSLPVFTALPEERPALMAQYLEAWYEASRREDYYDRHETGYQFVGYWSWEAAAITLVLGIDDSSYRDMPYYPKDMADFARQANAGKMPVYTAPAIVASDEPPLPASASASEVAPSSADQALEGMHTFFSTVAQLLGKLRVLP
ncbi:PoNe immunity protein domain-containing protein [Pseudoduganella violaceinigra]|uniref:PoNe immunity protein domain-containing protein n=1 Tax=Pseudoduganella violaceinigra TaxID=246602 RepID=UPI00040AEA70|nr:PoNe immunity protein domain-containing protein [Pseudoduganella violaceinigra]